MESCIYYGFQSIYKRDMEGKVIVRKECVRCIMDTARYIKYNNQIDEILEGITYLEGTADELAEVIDYIEITSHIQEIYQWYQIFNYNLVQLKNVITSKNNIAINASAIAFLSAGKNLVESMELCMKLFYGSESDEYNLFRKDYLVKEYDSHFSYRFLTRLRNYSQHCHIPVSYNENGPCFDINQIYNTSHYSFNKTIKSEIDKMINDVFSKSDYLFTLAIEPTVCSYTCSVYKIYNGFLKNIRSKLISMQEGCFKGFEKNPELIEHKDHPDFEGMIFYIIEENPEIVYMFDTTEKPQELLGKKLNESIENLKQEQHIMKLLKKTMIPLKKCN